MNLTRVSALIALLSFGAGRSHAVERTIPQANIPSARIQSVNRMPPSQRLKLSIGLPFRNAAALTNLLRDLYDPRSSQFHRFLSPEEFSRRFGPSETDYQAVAEFSVRNGLTVRGTHPNRLILDVEGSVADVEAAFHVRMQNYPHPQDARVFFSPDTQPTVEARLPILQISGLDDFTIPAPRDLRLSPSSADSRGVVHLGSGPSGTLMGTDFRKAYVPGSPLTGSGQVVGLFELDGYFASDIADYETHASIPHVPLQNVLIDGFNGVPAKVGADSGNEEVALDIEMVASMAPGLTKVLVYMGSPTSTMATINDIFNRMATDNVAKQLSCSWGFDIDLTTQQIFQEFAAQGQSLFLASGDSGAFAGPVFQPSDNPFITVVGGTELVTDGAHNWVSESTWSGSSGGISTVFPLPFWQEGIDMTGNGGSTTMRNVPDVAMVADNVFAVADRGQSIALSGTSIAAPLWAGFTALANQQAASQGKPLIGFVNPTLYAIAGDASQAGAFHDITTGNNTTTDSPDLYHAAPGYDLCTGLGSPSGARLINALLGQRGDSLIVSSPLGFSAFGPVGGPFNVQAMAFSLTNSGSSPLEWRASSDSDWLSISPVEGVLAPGGSAASITVSLAAAASKLLIGSHQGTVSFLSVGNGTVQRRQFVLSAGNGDFETGDFRNWTVVATPENNFADSVDATQEAGSSSIPGVDDSQFVHAGIYGAFLGQANNPGYLSQSLPTVPGASYVVTFWLANPAVGTPNEFAAYWNDSELVDQVDSDPFQWTRMQYLVIADRTNSNLKFAFQNDEQAFGLDDVSVDLVEPPSAVAVTASGETITLTWSGPDVVSYQVQSTDSLEAGDWVNLDGPVFPSQGRATATDAAHGGSQRFYRVLPAR